MAAQPNIVFILADDLGYGDTKIYGGENCRIETPNIDALAKVGIKGTREMFDTSLLEEV